MRGRLTLPEQRRLRRKSDFEAAYARGRRLRAVRIIASLYV
jgi:RNase P protein component